MSIPSGSTDGAGSQGCTEKVIVLWTLVSLTEYVIHLSIAPWLL